jgi:hypothetical protein
MGASQEFLPFVCPPLTNYNLQTHDHLFVHSKLDLAMLVLYFALGAFILGGGSIALMEIISERAAQQG